MADSVDPPDRPIETVPDGLTAGSTVLVASAGEPSRSALGLRLLGRFGTRDDSAVVVTTTESAERTVETFEELRPVGNGPSIGLVDTVSEQQSVSARYDAIPVVYTPSSSDLERLVMALSEVAGQFAPSAGDRHLLVRSLTPLLKSTSTARVASVLDRITGYRSDMGISMIGLDYTALDAETMATVTDRVDGILWATQGSSDGVDITYSPARARHARQVRN